MAEKSKTPEARNKKKPNPIDVHVGGQVRLRRTILGMSQEKLGDSLGITFQQIQKYEKGVNRIGASRLQEIAIALDAPISFFFEGAPKPAKPPKPDPSSYGKGFRETSDNDFMAGSPSDWSPLLNSAEGLSLIRHFTRIEDPRIRRSLVELVRSVAGEAK